MVEAPEFREMAGSLISKNGKKVLKTESQQRKEIGIQTFCIPGNGCHCSQTFFTAAPVIS